jgi:8-oxo-dGTP pyrophosphatase MutT (NUDIX family)
MTKPPHIEVLARALVMRGDQVLLCGPQDGDYWYLPGGHVEFDEPAPQALAREFQEELGVTPNVGPCRLIYELRFNQEGRRRHEIGMVFHVEPPFQDPVAQEPHIRFEWVPLALLVDRDLRPALIRAWLVSGGHTDHTDQPGWLSAEE